MTSAASDPSPLPSIHEVLNEARALSLDRIEAQWLIAAALEVNRAWLMAHGDQKLSAAQAAWCRQWIQRKAAGEPLAYVLGHESFHGLRLAVNPAVLIPRIDTECLLHWAIEKLGQVPRQTPALVADLGTGSGALALALKSEHPEATIIGVDASAAALAVAQSNGQNLNLQVDWRLGSWWSSLQGLRLHLAISNPPYIAEGDPHLQALGHEPRSALVSGADGLDDLRCIIKDAPDHLAPGAWLLLEHGFDQHLAVQALLQARGFRQVQSRQDSGGQWRCTGACWMD